MINIKKIIPIAIIFVIIFNINLFSQNTPSKSQPTENNKVLYPDKYSELDNAPPAMRTNDNAMQKWIKVARQKYLQALIFVENGDTLKAGKFFREAMEELNNLVSYPEIEQNDEFTDLAQSIIEDYENFVSSIDQLDENTPLFIIRNRFFVEQEEEDIAAVGESVETFDHGDIALVETYKPDDFRVIPLVNNEHVQKSLEWLTETNMGRKFMKKWLERTTKWLPLLKRIASEEGLPEEIVYLSMIESGLNPNAVSRAKAVGLWQFMRPTGMDYGLNINNSNWLDERRDPEKSTRAAMRYLKDLFTQFADWHLALAAYNCGPGRVTRILTRSGIAEPDYWSIRHLLPKETRYYVARYIATAKITMNPEKYNFTNDSLVFEEPYQYDVFRLSESVSLDVIAKCCEISSAEIQNLNPEIVKSVTPPDVEEYVLKLPVGSIQKFVANFASLTPEEKQPWIIHEVKRRETLSILSKKYGVGLKDLVELNGFSSYNSKLRAGTEIRILLSSTKYNEINLTESNDDNPLDGSRDVIHTVKKGETLHKIANKYNVSIHQLRVLNGISTKSEKVVVGQKIFIVKKDESLSANQKSGKPSVVRHKVERGETLSSIAAKYNTTTTEIKKTNKIKKDIVAVGRVLKVKSNSLAVNTPQPTNSTQRSETTLLAENTTTKPEPIPTNNLSIYKVQKGDNLSSIASANGMTNSELMQINDLQNELIYPGQRLKLKADEQTSQANNKIVSKPVKMITHKVKGGENLSLIAARYSVSEEDIINWNKDRIEGSTIYAGTVIKIAENTTSKGSSPQADDSNVLPTRYKIKSGDTISSIARKFGVTIAQLKQKNKNLNEDRIQIGQVIRLK